MILSVPSLLRIWNLRLFTLSLFSSKVAISEKMSAFGLYEYDLVEVFTLVWSKSTVWPLWIILTYVSSG